MSVATRFSYTAPRGVLDVSVMEARTLLKTHHFSTADPYCKIQMSQYAYETPVSRKGGATPAWNVELPPMVVGNSDTEKLRVEIWDQDTFGADRFMGQVTVTIAALAGYGSNTMDNWFQLSADDRYKAHGDISGDIRIQTILTATQQQQQSVSPTAVPEYLPPTAPHTPKCGTVCCPMGAPMPPAPVLQQQPQQIVIIEEDGGYGGEYGGGYGGDYGSGDIGMGYSGGDMGMGMGMGMFAMDDMMMMDRRDRRMDRREDRRVDRRMDHRMGF